VSFLSSPFAVSALQSKTGGKVGGRAAMAARKRQSATNGRDGGGPVAPKRGANADDSDSSSDSDSSDSDSSDDDTPAKKRNNNGNNNNNNNGKQKAGKAAKGANGSAEKSVQDSFDLLSMF
jgi:hypothetical protein